MRAAIAAVLLSVTGCASSFVELPFGDDESIVARADFAPAGRVTVEIAFPRELILGSGSCAMIEHARDFVAESLEYDGQRGDAAQWWYLRSFASPGYGTPHQGVRIATQIDAHPDGKPKHARYAVRLTAVGQDSSGTARVMQAIADFATAGGGAADTQELCWRELSPQEVESGGIVLPRGCDCPGQSHH